MKKVLLLAMSFCMLNAGYSVYGGMAMTSINFSADMGDMESKMTPSFTVGGSMDAGPVKVGVGFTQRVGKLSATIMDIEMAMIQKHNYIDMWVAYPYQAGPVALYGGLMLGMAMGDATYSAELDGTEIPEAECAEMGMMCGTVSGEDANRASLDYGLLLGVSYPINDSFSASLGYYLGLADIADENDTDDTAKWSGLMVTGAYSF